MYILVKGETVEALEWPEATQVGTQVRTQVMTQVRPEAIRIERALEAAFKRSFMLGKNPYC